jgi:hypothetical protein
MRRRTAASRVRLDGAKRRESEVPAMRRLTLSVFLLIGLGLIIAPVSMSMFGRSSKGENMINDFRTLMQPANVATTADYYDNVFTKLRPLAQLMPGVQQDVQKLIPALAQATHQTPAQVQQMLTAQFPSLAKLLQSLPQRVAVMKRVPAGLDWYLPLVRTMQANTGNYAAADALPPMSVFPWFFVVPGILLVLAAAYLLVGDFRPDLVWPKLGPRPTLPRAVAR